jgi:predicted lipoprotein with Yx(FWY)xxD motif
VRQTGASRQLHRGRRGAVVGFSVGTAALALAACGSSGSVKAGSSGGGSSATTAASGRSSSPLTISAANVPGLGMVLVNGSGQTLYMLTTDTGGKISCTDDNGCTAIWPDTELPSGQTAAQAGTGIQASLLSTVKDASGSLYVTYGGWPLYTFSGDKSAGQVAGEGVNDKWGTWYVLGVDGKPIKTRSSGAAPTTTTAPQSGGAGF